MRFSAIALLASVPAFVSAANLTINVGANGALAFDPPSMNASVGDNIAFVFQAKNHSVIQSTFAAPCNRSNVDGTPGFGSDFFPVGGSASQFPSYTLNVTQTAPIWFYCSQKIPVDHCKNGMVGVINPTADKTLEQFKATAMSNTTATSSAAPTPTSSNGAMRIGSGTPAGLLTLFGVVAGVAL